MTSPASPSPRISLVAEILSANLNNVAIRMIDGNVEKLNGLSVQKVRSKMRRATLKLIICRKSNNSGGTGKKITISIKTTPMINKLLVQSLTKYSLNKISLIFLNYIAIYILLLLHYKFQVVFPS